MRQHAITVGDITLPDGTRIITRADGQVVTIHPDGETIICRHDGTTITRRAAPRARLSHD